MRRIGEARFARCEAGKTLNNAVAEVREAVDFCRYYASDCLDTWFSSWLWPITVFAPALSEGNKELEYYYPTSDLQSLPLLETHRLKDSGSKQSPHEVRAGKLAEHPLSQTWCSRLMSH